GFGLCLVAIAVNADEWIADLDLAAENLAKSDTTEVVRIIKIGDEQFQIRARMGAGRWNVFDDRLKQRVHGAADVLQFNLGESQLGTGINHRKIELLVGRVK